MTAAASRFFGCLLGGMTLYKRGPSLGLESMQAFQVILSHLPAVRQFNFLRRRNGNISSRGFSSNFSQQLLSAHFDLTLDVGTFRLNFIII
jgi:hypothetical protein